MHTHVHITHTEKKKRKRRRMKNRRKRTKEKVKSPTCLSSELCITVQQMIQKSVALKDNMLIIIALSPEFRGHLAGDPVFLQRL